MPPRRKKSQKNELDRLSALSAKLGIDVDKLLEEVPLTEVGEGAVIRRQIEAESVLFYIETQGQDFISKNCNNPNCARPFLHTYRAVDYCSEDCRAWALAQVGIVWNFHRKTDSQRWNVNNKGYVPKIIGVEATAALVESGNIFTELPEEGVIEEPEEVPMDPEYTYIGEPPGKGPVDEYEKQERIADAVKQFVEEYADEA